MSTPWPQVLGERLVIPCGEAWTERLTRENTFFFICKRGKQEFKCCAHGLKSAIIFTNIYSETNAPSTHQILCSHPARFFCKAPLLWNSVSRFLCIWFLIVSLIATLITLCLELTARVGWDQGLRKHLQRTGDKRWDKDKRWVLSQY